MPLIATLPSASARTAALAQVWHSVVQADLATRRAVRSGDKAVPGAQLKNILTEPFVMSIVSGTFTGEITRCHCVPFCVPVVNEQNLPPGSERGPDRETTIAMCFAHLQQAH